MILNSKAEYNRCHIPRLRVEQEEEVAVREEQQKKLFRRVEEELSGSSKLYTEEHTGGEAISTRPPTTTTPGEQQLEVGCDNADKAVSLSKETFLATPPIQLDQAVG